jgi:hypothetical protein
LKWLLLWNSPKMGKNLYCIQCLLKLICTFCF